MGRAPSSTCFSSPSSKNPLEDNGIAEGAAMKIRASFPSCDALDAFNSQNEEEWASLGGFSTLPHAMNYFLRTYAKDEYLEDAFASLHRMV